MRVGKHIRSIKEWGHVVGNEKKSHRILCQSCVPVWGIRYFHIISVITEVLCKESLVYLKKSELRNELEESEWMQGKHRELRRDFENLGWTEPWVPGNSFQGRYTRDKRKWLMLVEYSGLQKMLWGIRTLMIYMQ